ncbi:MAG: DUF3306 domain-containing protein [Roseateles depolymerans]|uniref:DUF3306 domain-containing protein n=1 Tax=Roseateles depolymerans TaxID=76731 RepID=A0A2W5FMA6_9BURK|nr:MAG: DUF3306 domain-containing protein [Roseateles depolymerans]
MAEDDSFFSRWSRRKGQARQGLPLEEPPAAVPEPAPAAVPAPPAAPETQPVAVVEAAALPTLDDVAALPADAGDFSRFVARGVQPEVKNAALKKLFSDPHFNVMDGLDIYIDDYSQPDPLPESMLRQMVQSQVLGLFDEAPDEPAQPVVAAGADAPDESALAEPSTAPETLEIPSLATASHEDADLRLQPDPAAGPGRPAAGLEPGAGRQH